MPSRPADTLGMNPEEMRVLGYLAVDMVVDHLVNRDREPAIAERSRAELERLIGGPLPEEPGDARAALETIRKSIFTSMQHGDHPRYFSRVPGPSSFAAVVGDWLAIGFNAMAASWGGGSGPTVAELVVLDWLRQMLGLPPQSDGILVSGGSMANFTAFAAAFAMKGKGRVYLNDQTHSSIRRNLEALGLGADDIKVMPTQGSLAYDMTSLRAAIADDRRAGMTPVMIIANAGTTNTGACDPMNEIADLCVAENLWMHVDGAYGGPAAFTVRGRALMQGFERADSLVLDPHKWLFQPYDAGCVLVRHPGALERAFSMNPEYLKDVTGADDEPNLRNRSLELTRRSRAIKLWMTFRTHGARRLVEAIDRGISLAEFAEAEIRRQAETWELVTPAQIGIVTFALRNAQPGQHARLVKEITASGYASLSSTEILGRSVLRLCIINPLTSEDDIRETLRRLAQIASSSAFKETPR